MDNLDDIESKLVDIVDQILLIGKDIPRPENLITTTKKLYQMSIPSEHDQLYQKIRREVSRIAKLNIANTKQCLEIYNKYTFLLNEMRIIDEWVYTGGHDRREYALTFLKYRNLYE